MRKLSQAGFTLYELMITLLIVGVVLSLGIPNLSEFTQNSRITGTANDLHAAFQMARSESARAKSNITICASNNSMVAGAETCGGTWEDGFIVFVDDDANLARNAGTEPLLRAHPATASGVSLAVGNDASYFMYASTGLGRRDITGLLPVDQIIMCDKRGVGEASKDYSYGRLFVATPLGRATIVRDHATVDSALTAMGKSCP